MTRLASLCAGALEVLNAIAVRLEDVIGEWVDNLGPRPATKGSISRETREQTVAEVVEAIDMYLDSREERSQIGDRLTGQSTEYSEAIAKVPDGYQGRGERFYDQPPIAALIAKRDNMVAACRITLAGRLANFVDGVTAEARR